MNLISRWTRGKRLRAVARRVGQEPTPENYVALAQEFVVLGETRSVLRVCTEGLELHPGNADLLRMAERARELQTEQRVRELEQELSVAPRRALYRELCELLLETAHVGRAQQVARRWNDHGEEPEALLVLARCHAQVFYEDRRAHDGRRALELAASAAEGLTGDRRPHELRAELCFRARAWQEARAALARLLELRPGDPSLEARFRDVLAREGGADLDRALLEVERSGELEGDAGESCPQDASQAVRPMLQALGQRPGVHAALFQRGSTALVQGLHGATADRTARVTREVLDRSRAGARRLGLGRPLEVLLEGPFGALTLQTGAQGAAALWTQSVPRAAELQALAAVARTGGSVGEVPA